jgi:hypothetical protein
MTKMRWPAPPALPDIVPQKWPYKPTKAVLDACKHGLYQCVCGCWTYWDGKGSGPVCNKLHNYDRFSGYTQTMPQPTIPVRIGDVEEDE